MTPTIATARGICSGQNLTTLQDRDTCPIVPGEFQVDNELEVLFGSHSTPRREPRALPRAHIQPRGYDLKSFLSPTSATTRSLLELHDIGSPQRFPLPLDTAQQQGFSDREGSYAATISPCSKYSAISVATVMNSGGYPDMPIPTIKHNNLSGYGKILTCKLSNCGDLRNSHHQLQRYRVLIHLGSMEELGPG